MKDLKSIDLSESQIFYLIDLLSERSALLCKKRNFLRFIPSEEHFNSRSKLIDEEQYLITSLLMIL